MSYTSRRVSVRQSLWGIMLCVSALVSCTSVGAAPTPTAGPPRFTDPSGRFSFHLPPEWQSRSGGAPGTIAAWQSQNPPGNFEVAAGAVSAGTTLDAYVTQVIPGIKVYFPDATVDASKARSLTLGGLPARRLDYTGTAQGIRLQVAQVLALQNNVAYTLTIVTSPATFAPFMERAHIALDSFAFLMPTITPANKSGNNAARAFLLVVGLLALVLLITFLAWGRTQKTRRASAQAATTLPMYSLTDAAPSPPGLPATPTSAHRYPGDSALHAISLNGATATLSLAEAEQRFLTETLGPLAGAEQEGSPGWRLNARRRHEQEGRPFDILDVTLPDGTHRFFWFDASPHQE